jgi:hypothetical protein
VRTSEVGQQKKTKNENIERGTPSSLLLRNPNFSVPENLVLFHLPSQMDNHGDQMSSSRLVKATPIADSRPHKIFDLSIHDPMLFLKVFAEVNLAGITFCVDAVTANFWAGVKRLVMFLFHVFIQVGSYGKWSPTAILKIWSTVSVVAAGAPARASFLNFHIMIASEMRNQMILALETVQAAIFLAVFAWMSLGSFLMCQKVTLICVNSRKHPLAFRLIASEGSMACFTNMVL